MSASTSGIATPAEDGAGPGLRKLKILMLHGYTQSGPLFHAKTRALEKILHKAFPSKPISPLFSSYPGGVQLFYPTAPLRLVPADIPGYNVEGPENGDLKEETDAWGWWKRETGSAVYSGLEEGLRTIRQTIEDAGGVDGVIGFSQGGCAAAFVASLLEPGRRGTFQEYKAKDASAFGYPEGWDELQKTNGELKFAVSYSGFYAPVDIYKGFYEPKIKTKFLSVIGSLDSVVEEHRSKGLVERTEGGRVVFHAGGHFVPVGKDMAGVVVGFIKECCLVKDNKEESVEDMDVPF
ncbi:hypothetical protein L207DRAFT_440700 [Hyaloscypha variabilis F]|uniref:Serine hydrolase domain-containing protein n=1 Tax=Hyaloscypha variabilis (strain UAMH 11265 / GT02V1 / F) TaxID=1149755 RepID=A0A2J6R1X7_HYAVF|nr:hypothetical protein L207DRAFT_440700 [Hyaloscypha variabilis F]